MYKYVLINEEGNAVVRGSTYQELVQVLVEKSIVRINANERFWEVTSTGKRFQYIKQEEEVVKDSGFTPSEFLNEANRDILWHLCQSGGYVLYTRNKHI